METSALLTSQMYFVTVSMLFFHRKDGGRSKASPTVLDSCSVGNGIQGRRSKIKQNQGLLHINHTVVQLLSTLYNLTIYSSLCSWCACVCVCVYFIILFFPSAADPLENVYPVYALSYTWQGDFPCCHPPYTGLRCGAGLFGAQSLCLHSQAVLLQRDIQLAPLWPTFGFDEAL